ncbi:50S ribosomal protein L25 [Candidatus Omnitrophota bacterium]
MEKISLKAEQRIETGKEAVKKLRSQGLVPAVVYKGKNSTKIKVFSKDFLEVIHTKAGANVIVNLQLQALEDTKSKTKSKDLGKVANKNAIIKEIQYHPLKGDVLHVDFHEISLSEAITVKVPVHVKGDPEGVKQGGILEHVLWEIEIECLPTQIPENIPIDVAALKIGDSVLVKDLNVAPEIKVLTDPESVVITVAAPRAEEEAAAPVEGEEQLEPEVIKEKKPEEEVAPGEEDQAGKEKKV